MKRFGIVALAAITLILVACGGGQSTQAVPPDRVTVQLSWIHSIEFSGFYMAEANGYYTDENLEVELRSGGFDADGNYINPVDQITSGQADLGITEAGVLLRAREAGAPIVAIATIYQHHPIAFTSLAEKEIVRPADLIGKTVMISVDSTAIFQALLASQGIDPAQVNVVERTDYTIAPLTSGEADVIDGWVTNEAVRLQEEGYAFNMILPSDYGIDLYPNVIFTTEELIASNPDLVERFLRATLRGIQSAIENPERAAELSVTYNSELTLESETAAMYQSLALLNPAGSNPGMMTDMVWETTHRILVEQGVLSGPLDFSRAYTLTFLNAIYGQ